MKKVQIKMKKLYYGCKLKSQAYEYFCKKLYKPVRSLIPEMFIY